MRPERNAEFSELLEAARKGDEAAIRALHDRHAPAVLARIRDHLSPLLRRRYDTLDLGQSVFAEVLGSLAVFEDRGEDAFRHWLYLKAENKVRSKLRRQLDPKGLHRETGFGPGGETGPIADGPGPATRAGDGDDRALLSAVLDRLAASQREVLLLRTRDELPFAEIAERLGLPSPDAARMRYARALKALRRLCAKA